MVIPARYASTRLPGKPLADLVGRPLVVWVAERAQAAGAAEVVIATDDQRIADAAHGAGFDVQLTSNAHASGSDRVMEVAERRGWTDDEVLVNVQGDEPLLPPEVIAQLGGYLAEHPRVGAATLAARCDDPQICADPNVVKVVRSESGLALYFSRAVIPHYRVRSARGWLRHIGIYGFRVRTLRRFCTLPASPLEQAESLEQLRMLDNDLPLVVLDACADVPPGVDTAEDLPRVRALLGGD